jgi:hypothetical protein
MVQIYEITLVWVSLSHNLDTLHKGFSLLAAQTATGDSDGIYSLSFIPAQRNDLRNRPKEPEGSQDRRPR